MTDDELDPAFRELLRGYRTPPEPPRAALWARIARAREEAPDNTAVTPLGRPARRLLPFLVPAALAAAVLIAFGLGRLTAPTSPIVAVQAGTPAPIANVAQRLVADNYLGQVELFLTDFRAEARSGRPDPAASERARRLLSVTRLLLDSPSGETVRLKPLLQDLELILAEIAHLPAESSQDLDLITDNLDRQGTIARLRSSVPAGAPPVMQGEI